MVPMSVVGVRGLRSCRLPEPTGKITEGLVNLKGAISASCAISKMNCQSQ